MCARPGRVAQQAPSAPLFELLPEAAGQGFGKLPSARNIPRPSSPTGCACKPSTGQLPSRCCRLGTLRQVLQEQELEGTFAQTGAQFAVLISRLITGILPEPALRSNTLKFRCCGQ